MVRLQRVTFTALHQYLGLSAELVNQGSYKKKHSPFSGSPVRSRTRENFANQTTETNIGSELAENLESLQKELNNISTTQPIPIIVSRRYDDFFKLKKRRFNLHHFFDRSRNNLDLKNSYTSSQFSQTSETVSEFDSPWPKASSSNVQSQQTDQQLPSAASRKVSRNEGLFQLDEAQVIQIAIEAFVRELGLEDDSVLRDGKVQIRDVPTGTYLMKEESHKVKNFFYLKQNYLKQDSFILLFFPGCGFGLCCHGFVDYKSTSDGGCGLGRGSAHV